MGQNVRRPIPQSEDPRRAPQGQPRRVVKLQGNYIRIPMYKFSSFEALRKDSILTLPFYESKLNTYKSITTIEMCLATKCRNSADPESPSPILQKARSSYDLSVTQCLSDLAAGRTTSMDLNHCETEEQERTQFVPHADETKDLTETIDKYFGALTDEFPIMKKVTRNKCSSK